MLKQAKAIQEQLTSWRRDFHMYPELGFQEKRTSAKVAEICRMMGLRVREGVGKTGVVAELGGGRPTIAIRADMDALPILEANDVDYCSRNHGVMHACGHDAHTAMALGAAHLLSKEKLIGSIRFLFQPSEEVADKEGMSGAPRMIMDGAMEGVDLIIAQHVDPSTPVGFIRVGAGPASGGVDSWFGSVIGKGSHGARPFEGIDPVYISAHVIFALNAIISRQIQPFDPAVVSIGSMHGGQAENVIPDRVMLTGTLRYTEARVQEQIHAEIRHAFELCRALGGDCELRIERGTPPMQNHPAAVALIEEAARECVGRENILPMEKELGAEDFGCYSEIVPGAMYMLGTRIDGNERFGHNPRFDIDEQALAIGTAVLAAAAIKFLAGEGINPAATNRDL